MDPGFALKLENPRNSANLISKLFLTWMVKLCYKGTQKDLEVLDLYKTLNCDKSQQLTDKLEKNWELEVAKAKSKGHQTPSLLRAIIKTFIWRYMLYGVFLFIQLILFRSFQPVVLAYFIDLFSQSNDSHDAMYISAAILVTQSILSVFFTHHVEFGQTSIGMRIRVAVSSLVYRKILKLNKKSLGQTAAGQVVNLLSNDVNRFDLVVVALHYFWIMPFQVFVVTWLIWREVGISSLAGVLSMVLLTLPVQGYLGKLTSKLRLNVAERTDKRVKMMSEVIAGIQVIKMYAWEKPFEFIIKLARKKEVDVLTKANYLRGVYLSCMVFIERAALFLTIVCYVLLGNAITPGKVFSMAQFFNILQLAMAICYPMAITFGAETLVSIKRLQEFLVLEEKPQSSIKETVNSEDDVVMTQINSSWVPGTPTIKNLDLKIPRGCLCAIIGPVGAGKSSILQLLLGELVPSSGTVRIGGTIAYASQEPWLFAASVRNNIVFGQEYDKNRYKTVVKVCALEKDFEQFPQGDKTMVGERGVSLSGGQRARINLARAVYREADIYLMDDPLSAVDTHVGKHLFDKCITQYLRNKTRILVTHQLQYLKNADLIVVINEGNIEAQGTFEELQSSDLDFTKMLIAADETVAAKQPEKFTIERKQSIMSHNSVASEVSEVNEVVENEEQMGSENNSPFKEYIKASGGCCSIFGLCFILILGQATCSSADYWVTFWTQQEVLRHSNDSQVDFRAITLNSSTSTTDYFYRFNWESAFVEEVVVNGEVKQLIKTNTAMYVYTALILAAIVITLMRSFAFFKMAMNASKNLHNKMFHALLAAPMRFFDTNPSGRVLNRFSKDMGSIDELLPRFLMDAIQIILVMSGILVMVAVANYYMIIAMVVLGALFMKVRSWYVMTAKDIKHLEGITKSPVYSHLTSSLNGITTIRAFAAEGVLTQQFDCHQDIHTSAWFLTIASRVCFGLWLDLISVFFIAVVAFSFVLLDQFVDQVSGSMVGLAISQALILMGMLQFGIRQTAEVINQLTSVERIMHYTKLESEEKQVGRLQHNLENNEKLFASDKSTEMRWPNAAHIVFKNLSLRYSEFDDPVLKGLSIDISSGSKIGIVGRTGAGKSSLIQALFRLAPTEGTILIDDIDTKEVSLRELRKKISIIPQEPVLFSETLRYNLDPFNEFDDEKLWSALDEVELKDAVTSLDFLVSEGGSNFSLGQRQLLCLARAILRNNKILVLDEATANVDPRTDGLIQSTIRRKFQNCTVLTIAHRLNTIMDSDKVLVMDMGRVAEYDHPHILLQNSEGNFYKMVQETGPTMAQQLENISREFYLSRVNIM